MSNEFETFLIGLGGLGGISKELDTILVGLAAGLDGGGEEGISNELETILVGGLAFRAWLFLD